MIVLDLKKCRENPPGNDQGTGERAAPRALDIASEQSGSLENGVELACQTLTAIQRCVFASEPFSDLAEKIDEVKAGLQTSPDQDALAQGADDIRTVLESFQDRVRESKEEIAIDFKSILNLVNESVACIQEGGNRSDEGLKHLEEGLKQAAKMESLVSVRRHLSEMLTFVRQESAQNLTQRDASLKSINAQLRQAQVKSSSLRLQTPGRLEALVHFRSILFGPKPIPQTNVTLFAANSLQGLRTRYGNEIASKILDELGRKQIQPLAPEGQVFCWSNTSLVLVWRPDMGVETTGMPSALPSTFETRAFVGTRMATFQFNIRSLSTSLISGIDSLAMILDRFCNEQDMR